MERYKHTVQYYETDKMGITHHSNYIRWMEEARVSFLSRNGWPYSRLEEMGIASPVIGVDCRYRLPTVFEQDVFITVFVEEFSGVRLIFRYEMTDAEGKLVCEGHSQHCFLGADGRPMKLSRKFPELSELFSSLSEKK